MLHKKPTQRQLRVGEEIRHMLSRTLSLAESGDALLDRASITITEVRVSPDLQNAVVYVMPLGGKQIPEILICLKERAWYFRKEVARQLTTRIAPRLVFHVDPSFDEMMRIDSLLRSPKVKRDIEKGDEE